MSINRSRSASLHDDIWNHRGPVIFSPVFSWPVNLLTIFLTLSTRWVSLTRTMFFLVIALGVYNFLLPTSAVMADLSVDWILITLARNTALMIIVAGSLHLYLFTFFKQGMNLKFDRRQSMDKHKRFNFGNQVHDNIFWCLISGVPIWTAYEVLYFWGVANGSITALYFSDNTVTFFIWLLILPVFNSTHFYVIHRLLHWPPLYELAHRLHHRNIQIGPWSGMSMHPVEHILYISSVLIHFVIPTHPVLVLIHLYLRCLTPAFSHAGFEKLLVKGKSITEAADFHHQLHHKYFDCNYGNVEVPLDRWLNTLHDGTDNATAVILQKRRLMLQERKQNSG